jgi:phosphoribosylamine--glycine ligase
LDVVHAIKKEGHFVKMFIEEKDWSEIGDGFVPKVKNWQRQIEWADVIVFDYTGYGQIAAELRAAGKLVIGGTPYTDRLELDRSFGQEELRRHGVKILQYREFHSFEEAIAFVQAHPDRYVIKPCGEISELKQLLFVGQEEDGSDVARILRAYQKTWGDAMGIFQLQKRVSGVEIAVGAFFNGQKFIRPININFEHKNCFRVNWESRQARWGRRCFGTNKTRFLMRLF